MKLAILCAVLATTNAYATANAYAARPRLAPTRKVIKLSDAMKQPPRAAKLVMDATAVSEKAAVDLARCATYPLATATQFALIAGIFKLADATLGALPSVLVPPIFAFLSLRSRVFSVLSASRPKRSEQGGTAMPEDVKRPSWTPPGIAFPFIWLTITMLRAASSLLVWRATGRALFSAPLLVLVFHLCVGDTWNCITNVERRKGTSALGVLAVLASVYAVVAKYYSVVPAAGLVLAPSALWISIASVLTWTIWDMNEREPLLPLVGDGKSCALRLPLSSVFEK